MANTQIYTYENQADFLKAFVSGDLKGFMPIEKIDSNALSYPLKIEAMLGNYTFKLYKEPIKETPKAEAKKGLSKKQKIIIGCSVAGGVIVLAIIGIVIWLCVR